MFSQKLANLIDALTCLPSVGHKTAQRLAIHLMQHDRQGAKNIAHTLLDAEASIVSCQLCRNLSDDATCLICRDARRDTSQICVVEGPMDILSIEQSTAYRGLYYVLMGHLSPLDGIGPQEIGLDQLANRLQNEDIVELILATNATVEGDATAYYISELAKRQNIHVSRLALGIPMGSELEYVDKQTLGHAFSSRTRLL